MQEDISKLLREYDLAENSPAVLLRESSDNEVYLVGQSVKTILRISKRLPVNDVKFESEAISYLSKSGVVVPKVIPTKNGDLYSLCDGKVAILFEYLEGHHIKVDKDHLPTEGQAYSAGKTLGLIHNVASQFTSSAPRKRTIFSELERAQARAQIFGEQFEGGKEFMDQVDEAISFGRSQKEIGGLIHNDYRSGNVFFNDKDEVVGVIDFDWCCVGPIVKDFALAVVEWSFPDGLDEPNEKIFDSFLAGYNSVASIKFEKNANLYAWIRFATLSDTATYFSDLIDDPASTKRIIKSYMYRKYLYYKKI